MSDQNTIKILLLEDNEGHIELIRRSLKKQPKTYDLTIANTVKEARNLFHSDYDMAIADAFLPDGNGIELLSLANEKQQFPVVIMTNFGDETMAVKAIKAGAIDYLIKTEAALSDMPHYVSRILREWDNILKRRKAEYELKISEEKYRTLQENIPIGIFRIKHDGTFISVNTALAHMSGCASKEELLNTSVRDYYIDREKNIELYKNLISKRNPSNFESTFKTKSGLIKHFSLNITPTFNEKGEVEYIDGSAEDISDKIAAENALRESENKYRTFIEQSLQGLIIFQDEQIVFTNPAFCKLIGYTASEILSFPISKFKSIFYNDDSSSVFKKYNNLLKDELEPSRNEVQIIKKDDSVIWVEAFAKRIKFSGKPALQIAIIDITKRKQMMKELKESEKKYRSLYESSLDGYLMLDSQGNISKTNRALSKMLGYTKKEITLKNYKLLLPPETTELKKIINTAIEQLINKGYTDVIETELVRKDKTVFPVEIRAYLLKEDNQAASGIWGFIRDITARKEMESELRKNMELYRILAENAQDIIIRYNLLPNFKYEYISPSVKKTMGYDPEEFYADPSLGRKLIHPDDWPIFKELLSGTRNFENNINLRWLHKNGTYIWNEMSITPIYDEKQNLIALESISRNINERKKTEKALEESEALYSALFHHNPIQTVVVDSDGRVIAFNMAKQQSGDRLPKTGDIMYKDYASSHLIDMYSHMMKCIQKGVPIEFFEQKYKEKYLTIKMSPFEGGAIITTQDVTAKKLAEEELRKSEEIYRLIADNMLDLVLMCDVNLITTYASPSHETILGYKPEELTGKSTFINIHPDDLNYLLSATDTDKTPDIPSAISYRYRHKDGHYLWLETKGHNITDPVTGKLFGAVFTTRDITYRKLAEEELRKSEEKYRLIADNMLDLISMCDNNFNYTFVSPSHETVLGYKPEELLGTPVHSYAHPNDAERIAMLLKSFIGLSEPATVTYQMHHKEGHYLWLETSGRNIFDNYGNNIGIVFETRDITERKRAEDQIKHLNQLLRSIQHVDRLITQEKDPEKLIKGACESLISTRGHSNVWIILVDDNNKYITSAGSIMDGDMNSLDKWVPGNIDIPCINRALSVSMLTIIRKPNQECTDCPLHKDYHGSGVMLIRLEYNNRIFGVMGVEVQSIFVDSEEERELLQDVADDIAFALYNIDLEKERVDLQKQLYRSAKLSAVGQLAAGIAHEFNNILSIILGHAQLSFEEDNPGEIKKSLQEIVKITKRGSAIVVKLSAFARPKEPNFKVQEITTVIDEVLKLQQKQLDLNNIKIEKYYYNHSRVSFDFGLLEQVLLNLMINAMHAIKPKGKGIISITLRDIDDNLEIKFSDNGIGMDDATKMRIFDPFFTTKGAWASDNLGITGTGLGLSITHTIIKQHKGVISVESERNIGTTFTIQIPISEKEAYKEPITINKIDKQILEIYKGIRVMVVDDEEDMAELMKIVFNRAGIDNVIIERKGLNAISSFKLFEPEIVFLDLIMPDMNGEQIFDKLKSINSDIPIVFISGKIDINKELLLRKGAYGFIQKPFEVNEIFDILNKIISLKNETVKK